MLKHDLALRNFQFTYRMTKLRAISEVNCFYFLLDHASIDQP